MPWSRASSATPAATNPARTITCRAVRDSENDRFIERLRATLERDTTSWLFCDRTKRKFIACGLHETMLGVGVLSIWRLQEADKRLGLFWMSRLDQWSNGVEDVLHHALVGGQRHDLDSRSVVQSLKPFCFPEHTDVRLTGQNTRRCLAMMDGGKPVVGRGGATRTLLACRDFLPKCVLLQHPAEIELHDAFVDWIGKRRPHIRPHQIVDALDVLRVTLCDHQHQFIVH